MPTNNLAWYHIPTASLNRSVRPAKVMRPGWLGHIQIPFSQLIDGNLLKIINYLISRRAWNALHIIKSFKVRTFLINTNARPRSNMAIESNIIPGLSTRLRLALSTLIYSVC